MYCLAASRVGRAQGAGTVLAGMVADDARQQVVGFLLVALGILAMGAVEEIPGTLAEGPHQQTLHRAFRADLQRSLEVAQAALGEIVLGNVEDELPHRSEN